MPSRKKPVIYSERYDVRLEPARLAYGMNGKAIEDAALDDAQMIACVKARSPTTDLPFAAVDDILIAGPVTILYHAAYNSDLMSADCEPTHLLESTMICEQVNNVLSNLKPLERSPYSVPNHMDSTTDRLMTVDLPDGLTLLERYAKLREKHPLPERSVDVADVAIAALHYYLTELTDIYTSEDIASLFPAIHHISQDVARLRCVSDWRNHRSKELMARGADRSRRCF